MEVMKMHQVRKREESRHYAWLVFQWSRSQHRFISLLFYTHWNWQYLLLTVSFLPSKEDWTVNPGKGSTCELVPSLCYIMIGWGLVFHVIVAMKPYKNWYGYAYMIDFFPIKQNFGGMRLYLRVHIQLAEKSSGKIISRQKEEKSP